MDIFMNYKLTKENPKELFEEIQVNLRNIFLNDFESFARFWKYPNKFWCNTMSPEQALQENPRSLLFLLKNYRFYTEE